jgi:hypothetical protein
LSVRRIGAVEPSGGGSEHPGSVGYRYGA